MTQYSRAEEDGPATTETTIDNGDQGKGQNGTERVRGTDDTLLRALRVAEV